MSSSDDEESTSSSSSTTTTTAKSADVDTFEDSGSGASHTIPQQAGTIKKGGYAMLQGHPCRIIETSTSKTGKHGHAKMHIVGMDIFTGKKYEDLSPTSHSMLVPIVTRAEYQLINISDDGFGTLLRDDGTTKEDLKIPEGEVGDSVRTAFEGGKDVIVAVIAACGEESVIGLREGSK